MHGIEGQKGPVVVKQKFKGHVEVKQKVKGHVDVKQKVKSHVGLVLTFKKVSWAWNRSLISSEPGTVKVHVVLREKAKVMWSWHRLAND